MRRRHDNNSSHCSCIPTSQGLPRYYFYFYKLLCIWITKLRDSLFKKKNERGGREERRNLHITEICTSLSSSHTGLLTALQAPQACACPGAFALAVLSVWNALESESQAHGSQPPCPQQRLHRAYHSSQNSLLPDPVLLHGPWATTGMPAPRQQGLLLFCSRLCPLSSE